MDLKEFTSTLSADHPPAHFNSLLQALWYDAKGNWEKSHDLISEIESKEAAHIHAYLHRKEGDIWNANYWYKSAGKKRPDLTLDEEWNALVKSFLEKEN